MKRSIVACAALLAALASCQDDATSPEPSLLQPAPTGASAVSAALPNGYIVVLKTADPRQVDAQAQAIARQHGGRVRHLYTHALRGFSVELPATALDGIRRNPAVAAVEPDYVVQAHMQPAPAGIRRVAATSHPTAAIDGVDIELDVDIAILDSGIDPTHPELRVAQFRNCVNTNNTDAYGHGTHVAGIAAARDNAEGVVGVAPGARLWAVKVLDDYGAGSLSSLICGVDYVTANAASIEVVNMSVGGVLQSDAFHTAIRASVGAGVFYAASAGNRASDIYGADGTFNTIDDYVPAAYPEVAAVSAMYDQDGAHGGLGTSTTACGATALDDTMACFSNFSRSVGPKPIASPGLGVDLAAPGVAVLSTERGGGYAFRSGTSMASPHVAGAAALLIVQRRTRDINGDGAVNGSDVVALRQALINAAQPQSAWRSDDATRDPDGNREPLLSLAAFVPPPPPPAAPAVTPDAGSTTTLAGSTGNVVVFTVANAGSAAESFTLACAREGQVSACFVPGEVSVAAGASAAVSVTYTAGTAGAGAVSLTATGQGGSDAGRFAVEVQAPPPPPAAPVVTPDNGSVTVTSGTTGNVVVFAVANPYTASQSFALACAQEGAVAGCASPAAVTVPAGGSAEVSVTFAAGSAGSGGLRLSATGVGGADDGRYAVTVQAPPPPPAPVVTPDGASATAVAGSTGNQAAFVVSNPHTASQSFALACTVSGSVSACTTAPSVTVPAGGSAEVAVAFSAGAAGSGTLQLGATGEGGTDGGAYGVTVQAPPAPAAPVVSPDGTTVNVQAGTTGNTLVFEVRNPGQVSESFALRCTVSGQVGACSAPASVTVAAGGAVNVTVSYAALLAGSGTLRLEAQGVAGQDAGTYAVTVTAPPPPSGMHVASLVLEFNNSKGPNTNATAAVTVVDAAGSPVSGALVTGDFYVNGVVAVVSDTRTTNKRGVAMVNETLRARSGDLVRFCVTKISHPDQSYLSGANTASCVEQRVR